jgi:putative sterol carrier protein
MAHRFPSDAWVKALMEELNQSAAYAEAAQTWEGDFYFIVDAGGALTQPVVLYLDLWHGKCREAFEVADQSIKTPVFRMSAPPATWKKVLTKSDPIQVDDRTAQAQGNAHAMVMKSVKAAKELVEATTRRDRVS